MRVTINGEGREVPDGLTVASLLERLAIHPGRVAVQRNLDILSRASWDTTLLEPGDTYEIVHFVGGG